jgi:hypothetical protein
MPSTPDTRVLAHLIKHAQSEVEDPLTPLIDDYFLCRELPKYQHLRIKKFEVDTGTRPRPPGRISPSSSGGCQRAAAYSFLGVKGRVSKDPDKEAIFEDGKWRHLKWDFIFLEMERFFPKKFKVVSIEESVSIDGLYIAGSLDAVVKIKVKGKWVTYVVDFKGANSFAFEDAYRNKKPNPRYVLQVGTYMKAKKKMRGILLFESKDKNRYYCFSVTANPIMWAEIKMWARGVLESLEAQRLPEKDPDCNKGHFLYGRCIYRDLCFGKKGDKQVQREVFVGFPGVKKLWKEGNRIVREWEAA